MVPPHVAQPFCQPFSSILHRIQYCISRQPCDRSGSAALPASAGKMVESSGRTCSRWTHKASGNHEARVSAEHISVAWPCVNAARTWRPQLQPPRILCPRLLRAIFLPCKDVPLRLRRRFPTISWPRSRPTKSNPFTLPTTICDAAS